MIRPMLNHIVHYYCIFMKRDNTNNGVCLDTTCFIMIYKLKTSFSQHVLLLAPLLVRYLFLFGLYFYYFGFHMPSTPFIVVFIIIFLTDILPALALHIQYLLKNGKSLVSINTETKEIAYKDQRQEYRFSFRDINQLHYYSSYGRGTGVYSFERYRYYRIVFSNNQNKIFITCLLMNKIEKKLEALLETEAEKHLRIFPFIY